MTLKRGCLADSLIFFVLFVTTVDIHCTDSFMLLARFIAVRTKSEGMKRERSSGRGNISLTITCSTQFPNDDNMDGSAVHMN